MSGHERLMKAVKIAEAATDRKAEDLVALDARGVASFADTFILATGNSDRHVRSIADAIQEAMSAQVPLGRAGQPEDVAALCSSWLRMGPLTSPVK